MVPICIDGVKEGLYFIEEDGRIFSLYKKDYLKPRKDKDGYFKINLSGGNRESKRYFRIATLVALTFIGKPPEGLKDPTINHIDGNKTNNHYSNLEWCERGKNSSIRKNKGEGSHNHEAILNELQVEEICRMLINTNLTLQEIANIFFVNKSTINNIKQKKAWKEISNKYDFSCRVTIRNSLGQFETINTNLSTGEVK